MMGLLKPKSYQGVDLSNFDITGLDFKTSDDKKILAAAEQIFAMIAAIVRIAGFKAMTNTGQEPKVIERDIGHGIKARIKETYASSCVIGDNIHIHHHNRTEHGLGGYEYEENLAWVIVGGIDAFQAQWGWDNIDAKSLFISPAPEARGAFMEIREKWQALACDKDR